MGFAHYVVSRRREDTKWGDVARDVASDPGVSPDMSYAALRAHMEAAGALPVVLDLLAEMHGQWQMRPKKIERARGVTARTA